MISTVTTTTTAVTLGQVMTYSIIAVIALILFLALKEILSSEVNYSNRISSFIKGSNIAIMPLLLVFAAVVTYKIATIL
ncbi:MAG: hypothetical protein CVV28_10270 [Methanobacteriales archaeon HGW-Methanobacteriales-1]|jgi:hypothetical protein|nr:hypothetical protein [Methanobacteriaceae archaeon]PKL66521.1 MAG: hypothetical protein CVV28_10270 [Methanobacteriales archaeon HGW-Methanobacteriales-1]